MELTLPVFPGLHLLLTDPPAGRNPYATGRLQKGLLMVHRSRNLAEEAVGFGLPMLQAGWQTLFPGRISVDSLQEGPDWCIQATYTLNLVEKISRPGSRSAQSRGFYAIKNSLAALIRAAPPVRAPLTALSSAMRKWFRLETTYEAAEFSAAVRMTYAMDPQNRQVTMEAEPASRLHEKISEVIVMNEQGARAFDHYHDSSGLQLAGKAIGCWDEVRAETAAFSSLSQGLTFSLSQVPGAHLFRGREQVGARLAWAGFGYSYPPALDRFRCSLQIEKGP